MANKAEREVLQATLEAEKAELKRLELIYRKALSDINENTAKLLGRSDAELQHVIYQLNYQNALKEQISGILDELHAKEYVSISEYIEDCYNRGYIGSMYSIHTQGIPIIMPINQKAVEKAIKVDSKISTSLYTKLGNDVGVLKKRIANNITRGIIAGSSYNEIAANIGRFSNVGMNNALRIARTEGHRVQCSASFDAISAAKEEGANVYKQWNATLDGATRETHAALDGTIIPVEEAFDGGAMFPGDFGDPAEDINCRCSVDQVAEWALDESELTALKERADYFGLDKSDSFNDFQNKYLTATNAEAIGGSLEMSDKIINDNSLNYIDQ